MSDIITVNDLNLWYGPTQALHHVTISVPEKSITALIGPSGCGKSTFLKNAGPYERPDPRRSRGGAGAVPGRGHLTPRRWTSASSAGRWAWCSKSQIPSP